jgi:hypothetical protein
MVRIQTFSDMKNCVIAMAVDGPTLNSNLAFVL